jgi:type IX secretion system PorP/SprF family membrane protein
MRTTFRTYFLSLALMLSCMLHGQDIHFSQYYLSPLTLNPANTGNYKGDYRFFANYRSQWRDIDKAYNTYSAGGDFNAYPNNMNLSGGLIFVSDRSGGNLVVNKIMTSGAYHRKLGGFKLHAGIQPGVVIKSIDFYKNSFPEQLNWETGVFDPKMPNSEANVVQRMTYFDLNMGVAASRRFGRLETEGGLAAFHITHPRESFVDRKSRLALRQAYNFAIGYWLTPNFLLKGHSLYNATRGVSDWVSGLNAEYVLSKNAFFTNSVFAGFMYRNGYKRNGDANILTVGINYSHYTLGFSYDITMSELKTAVDNKGAFEIAFIYRAKSTRLNKKILPCERY